MLTMCSPLKLKTKAPMKNIRKQTLFAFLIVMLAAAVAAPQAVTARSLVVGDSHGGGKIIYLFKQGEKGYDPNVQHGLTADTADLSGAFDWPDALAACERLKKNGYSDWYLPDRDELNRLHACRAKAGGFPKTGKHDVFYWSSSEKDADYSWAQSFRTGRQYPVDKMTKTGHVRAVRSF
jgi:hypothetical protein